MVRGNQVLCLDMDSMRRWVHELECECSSMKRVIEKMSPRDGGPWRASLALGRKFGCKFKTQGQHMDSWGMNNKEAKYVIRMSRQRWLTHARAGRTVVRIVNR